MVKDLLEILIFSDFPKSKYVFFIGNNKIKEYYKILILKNYQFPRKLSGKISPLNFLKV